MSKMKQLYTQMQEEGLSFNAVMSEDKAMMEEAHYYTLVENVARWMIENRSVSILDDIEKKYLQMWTFQ
jgi:hypothetical protein